MFSSPPDDELFGKALNGVAIQQVRCRRRLPDGKVTEPRSMPPALEGVKLTGRWVPFPALTDTAFWVQRFGRLAEEPAPEVGSCIAFTCTRRADSPVE